MFSSRRPSRQDTCLYFGCSVHERPQQLNLPRAALRLLHAHYYQCPRAAQPRHCTSNRQSATLPHAYILPLLWLPGAGSSVSNRTSSVLVCSSTEVRACNWLLRMRTAFPRGVDGSPMEAAAPVNSKHGVSRAASPSKAAIPHELLCSFKGQRG